MPSVHPSTPLSSFSSETAELIFTKLFLSYNEGGLNVHTSGLSLLTKLVAMIIYGRNNLRILSEISNALRLNVGIEHLGW